VRTAAAPSGAGYATSANYAATAGASAQLAPHVAEFLGPIRDRLRVSVVADATALGLREQKASLRLIEAVGRATGPRASELGLLELLRPGLEAAVGELLRVRVGGGPGGGPGVVSSPTSSEETRLAGLLPSGAPLPPAAAGGAAPPPCGTAYSVRVRATLEGSLCAAVSALGLPGVRAQQPLASVGEELLASALRAALRCLPHPASTLAAGGLAAPSPEPPAFGATSSLLAAAQTCLAVFGAFALHAAGEQLTLLRQAQAIAASRGRTAQPEPQAAAGVRSQLVEHAKQLRALAPALHAWGEAAMDEEGVDAPETRRQVLLPLADIAAIASRHAAQVEAMAEDDATGQRMKKAERK
jgi:hypothetical protein